MPASELRPITPAAAILALLCAALWGGTAVAIRYTQDVLPPFATAALRFGLSTAFLVGWCRYEQQSLRVQSGQLRPIVIIGVMLFAQIGLFHWGLTKTNSSHTSVLIGSHPVVVALVAHFVLAGDQLTWLKALGMSIAAGGLFAVIAASAQPETAATPGDPATLVGDFIVLTSSTLLAIKTVSTKYVLAVIEPGKLIFWSNLLGAVLLGAYSLAVEDLTGIEMTGTAISALLYQGLVVAGFCFAMWNSLLRYHRASELAVFAFFQPLCGVIFGVWLRGDRLSLALLAGTLAVATGIILVTRGGRKQTTAGIVTSPDEDIV